MLNPILQAHSRKQLYSLMSQLLMAGYGFGFIFIMIRLMSKDEVGQWMLFISAISLADMVMQGLLQTIIIRKTVEAKGNKQEMSLLQTNALIIAITLVCAISIILWLLLALLGFFHYSSNWLTHVASWYPLLASVMLVHNLSLWLNTGQENFKGLFLQRLIYCFLSILLILAYYAIYHHLTFQMAIYSQLLGYVGSSVYGIIIHRLRFKPAYFNRHVIFQLLAYGKFTVGTLVGSSLLRNSDTFMIGAFMNPGMVAVYTLSQKVVEIFEVILRSVASQSLPALVVQSKDLSSFSRMLYSRMTTLTLLFIPMSILIWVFSDDLIQWMSRSDEYSASATIVSMFMVYVVLLPADRLIGVALEAIHQPKGNLVKMIGILLTNLTGNFIAIHYFHSLIGVALISSLALLAGISIGYLILRHEGASRFCISDLKLSFIQSKAR